MKATGWQPHTVPGRLTGSAPFLKGATKSAHAACLVQWGRAHATLHGPRTETPCLGFVEARQLAVVPGKPIRILTATKSSNRSTMAMNKVLGQLQKLEKLGLGTSRAKPSARSRRRTAPRSTSNWSSCSRNAKRGTGPTLAGCASSGEQASRSARCTDRDRPPAAAAEETPGTATRNAATIACRSPCASRSRGPFARLIWNGNQNFFYVPTEPVRGVSSILTKTRSAV
jgi:hypothetical protein